MKCGDVKDPLEAFIKKHMHGPEDLQIVNVNRNKTQVTVLTHSNYCDTIKGTHEDAVMSYTIKGKEIRQTCPKCKKNTSRTHCLPHDIIKILKQ